MTATTSEAAGQPSHVALLGRTERERLLIGHLADTVREARDLASREGVLSGAVDAILLEAGLRGLVAQGGTSAALAEVERLAELLRSGEIANVRPVTWADMQRQAS